MPLPPSSSPTYCISAGYMPPCILYGFIVANRASSFNRQLHILQILRVPIRAEFFARSNV
ncbi:hypothetical protein DFH09DRAFT_1331417 [Mycena vulgaris]|nr:hypothetical protein DFH09DRAFT_1331417 [Mycena vulgaris]